MNDLLFTFLLIRSNDLEIELEKSQKENLLLRQQLTEIRNHYEKSIHPSSNAGTLSSVPQLPIGNLFCF